jgi:hypothetical protein
MGPNWIQLVNSPHRRGSSSHSAPTRLQRHNTFNSKAHFENQDINFGLSRVEKCMPHLSGLDPDSVGALHVESS